MNSRIMLVVGDKFSSFALGKDAITVSQLKGLMALPHDMLPFTGRVKLIPGQGMGEQCISDILLMASRLDRHAKFDFSLWQQLPARAPREITHKHQLENTLISTPVQIAQDLYEMHFLIDENSELMSDHQSGQHVQGMLLIEAVRQATVAITELFFLSQAEGSFAFVLNNMSVKYNNFSFPLPAKIHCRISDKLADLPKRLNFSIEADVVQCGTSVSTLHFEIAAMDKERIFKQENRQALKAQKAHMNNFFMNIDDSASQANQSA